jgi:hypothetical protein
MRRGPLALAIALVGLVAVVAAVLLGPPREVGTPLPTASPTTSPSPAASPTTSSTPVATTAPSPTTRPTASAVGGIWKRVTSTPTGGARVRDMYAGPGTPFIAVGHAEGVHAPLRSYVWTSQDGVSWRILPDDPVLTGLALSAIGPAPGSGSIAVGRTPEGNRILRSSDGTSWRKVVDLEGRDDNLLAVVRWSGGLVVAGTTSHGPALKGVVWTSSDGERFARAPDADHFTQATIADLAVHGDRLIAVGYVNTLQIGTLPRAAVWTSADGKSWTPVRGDGFENAQMEGVVASERGLVAVGSSSEPRGQAAWTSSDGITWKRVAHGAAFAPGLAPGGMRDVVLGPAGYVAIGNTGGPNDVMIWTSADGDTWTRADLEPALRAASVEAVATSGSRVVAGGVAGDQSIAFWHSPP